MSEDNFRFIDGIATADAAFEAYGNDLPQLLRSAAKALFSAIIDLSNISPSVTREVRVESDSEESLLYEWLSELVYLKDVHCELYSEFVVTIDPDQPYHLRATVKGASVDPLRHHTKTDVKAVTYHKLKIERVETGLKAFVILDL